MSRVITFSTKFPTYHLRAGEPTYFIDRLIKSFQELGYAIHDIYSLAVDQVPFIDESLREFLLPKKHTIRAGHRWKVGEKFIPRVWSGKPYRSHQVTLAEEVEVKRIWDFKITDSGDILINDRPVLPSDLLRLSINDGLSLEDLSAWFQYPKEFSGQIICWDDSVIY